jgi:GTP-binding protein
MSCRFQAARDSAEDKETGETQEPIEYLVVDVPEKNMGGVMELGRQPQGRARRMDNRDGQVHLEFTIPARG